MIKGRFAQFSNYRTFLLKTLLALSLPILYFTLVGCVPDEVPKHQDLGPKTSAAEIDDAIDEAIGPFDFEGVEVGEFAMRQVWIDIQGRNSLPQRANSIEVLTKTETDTEIALELVYTTLAYDQNGDPSTPNAREFPLSICKVDKCESPASAQSQSEANTPMLRPTELWIMANGEDEEPPEFVSVSYHNLKVKRAIYTPPKLVADHESCRGLSPCQLNVTIISYDAVFTDTTKDTHLYQVKYVTSTDLPFFSRYKIYLTESGELWASRSPLSFCQTYAIGATPVSVCEDLADFIRGQIDTED